MFILHSIHKMINIYFKGAAGLFELCLMLALSYQPFGQERGVLGIYGHELSSKSCKKALKQI